MIEIDKKLLKKAVETAHREVNSSEMQDLKRMFDEVFNLETDEDLLSLGFRTAEIYLSLLILKKKSRASVRRKRIKKEPEFYL